MKVVYLHGLGSSGQSATARRLDRSLPGDYEVIAPDIPVQPELAITALQRVADMLDPDDVVVGTSLGGLYAQLFHGWRRILVNPSFHTSRHLSEKVGQRLPFNNPRKDGATDFEVNAKLVKKFEKMEARQFDPKFGFHNSRPDSPELVTALFGKNDTVVNCKDEYLEHYTRWHEFEGEHRLDPDTMISLLIPLIVNQNS